MPNKPFAIMAADVNALALVLRETISDYPQYRELETATNASAKTLYISYESEVHNNSCL